MNFPWFLDSFFDCEQCKRKPQPKIHHKRKPKLPSTSHHPSKPAKPPKNLPYKTLTTNITHSPNTPKPPLLPIPIQTLRQKPPLSSLLLSELPLPKAPSDRQACLLVSFMLASVVPRFSTELARGFELGGGRGGGELVVRGRLRRFLYFGALRCLLEGKGGWGMRYAGFLRAVRVMRGVRGVVLQDHL